jgi:hypothetical protein
VRAATLTAITAGLGLGAAAPAQAAQLPFGSLIFGIVDESPANDYCWIPVDGHIWMSQEAAQGHINGGSSVKLELWGDDPSSDNLQYRYANPPLDARPDGLHFVQSARVNCGVLNEDSSWWEGAGDELYVTAKFLSPSGATLSSGRSATVSGTY